jgi:hypothetical protein
MNPHYRQGDVLLLKVDKLPPEAVAESPDEGRIVLAYGEVTGHAHAVSTAHAAMYKINEERYLVAEPGAQLVHEEHSTIIIDPGVYRVIRQREYSPREIRFVAD